MDQQKMFFPKGNPTDTFDKDAHGRFQSDLMNLAYDKHLSKERNIFLVGLCGVCVAAVVYIATTANYKTYVVRVNDATGQIEAGQQLKAVAYNPKEAEIKYRKYSYCAFRSNSVPQKLAKCTAVYDYSCSPKIEWTYCIGKSSCKARTVYNINQNKVCTDAARKSAYISGTLVRRYL